MLGHTMGAGKVDGENQIGICRVCMASKPDQVCIFNELNLSSKLIELADIQVVEGDGLPSAICTDCEADLQRCYEFRVQVRWADQKLRESSVSQIDVEECNIKLERDHGVCEKINERNDSDIEDYSAENESHCDLDETMNDTEDNIYPQVSHVEVAENKREDISMINDPLGLDEPLIEAAHMKSDVGSADDPLKFVKIETTEPMETDNFGASTSASTSSAVNRTVTSKLLQILPAISNTGGKFGGKVVEQHEKSSFVMLNQLLPPNTIITVSSTGLSKSSASPGLPTTCSIDSAMISPSNEIPVETPPDNNLNMEVSPDLTTDEIIRSQKQAFHQSLTNVSQTKVLSNCEVQVSKSSKISKYKSVQSEPSSSSTSKGGTKESVLETSLNSKPQNMDFETHSFSSSSTSVLKREVETKKNTSHLSFTFCFVCNMEFGALDLLQKHRESKQFFCRVCIVEFSNHNELEIHVKNHRPFKCRSCQALFFSKKDLFQHKQANRQCNYKIECEECKKTFYEERCLKIHMKRYHTDSSESYNCVVCGKTFTTLEICNYHLKRTHQAYEHLECQICSVLMVGPDRLKQHVKTTHLEASEGGIHVCSICKKICSTKSLLRNHMEIHDNALRLCEICGKSIAGKQPMRRHMAKEHSKTGFFCKTCKEQFSTLSELRKHVKHHKKPVDESVFCEMCGKKLKNSNTLKIHLQIHSEDKPFKCDVCGACFKQEVTLKTHQRVHSDLGKYFCNGCGLSFRWKQTFDKHVKKCGDADQNSFNERFRSSH